MSSRRTLTADACSTILPPAVVPYGIGCYYLRGRSQPGIGYSHQAPSTNGAISDLARKIVSEDSRMAESLHKYQHIAGDRQYSKTLLNAHTNILARLACCVTWDVVLRLASSGDRRMVCCAMICCHTFTKKSSILILSLIYSAWSCGSMAVITASERKHY